MTRKKPLVVFVTMENVNVGVREGKSVLIEGGKGNACKNNNTNIRPFDVKCYKCGEVDHGSSKCPKWKEMNVGEG